MRFDELINSNYDKLNDIPVPIRLWMAVKKKSFPPQEKSLKEGQPKIAGL